MTVIVIVISKALERISRSFFTNLNPMKITVRFLGLFQITVIDRLRLIARVSYKCRGSLRFHPWSLSLLAA